MSASSHRTTPPPATVGDMYLAAILDELRALNRVVGELHTALQRPPAPESTDTVDLRELATAKPKRLRRS